MNKLIALVSFKNDLDEKLEKKAPEKTRKNKI